MASYTGKIVHIGEAVNVGKTKPFFKRTVIVDDSEDERYPNPVPFEFTKGHTSIPDAFAVGDEVCVSYSLHGRKWTDKGGTDRYFLSATAFEMKAMSVAEPPTPDEAEQAESESAVGDDLPF